jgi:hypothetical protein
LIIGRNALTMKIEKTSTFIRRDTNHKCNLKFREGIVPVIRRAVLALLFILLMTRPIHAECIGIPAYPTRAPLTENLGDALVENFDLGKETLTFVVFQISQEEFRKWARECGIFWYLEVLKDPIEVTELVKNEKKSRYYKKEIYVKHGYLFIWDSEDYLCTTIYDMTNSTVYLETLRIR